MHLLHQFMRLQRGDPFGRNGRQHADGDPVAPVECQVLFDQRLGSVQHHGKDLRAGLTDHGVMFGIKELTDYCGKINKDRKKEGLEPFKPIIGCEMYVAPADQYPADLCHEPQPR